MFAIIILSILVALDNLQQLGLGFLLLFLSTAIATAQHNLATHIKGFKRYEHGDTKPATGAIFHEDGRVELT